MPPPAHASPAVEMLSPVAVGHVLILHLHLLGQLLLLLEVVILHRCVLHHLMHQLRLRPQSRHMERMRHPLPRTQIPTRQVPPPHVLRVVPLPSEQMRLPLLRAL